MKITVVFSGCYQVGQDTFADYHKTRVVRFTQEQEELLTPPTGMDISNIIFEIENEDIKR